MSPSRTISRLLIVRTWLGRSGLAVQMQQIIFMEGGRTIVGTHEELMAAVPVYHQLYESQTGLKGGEGA